MTLIIGYKTDTHIYLAADRLASGNGDKCNVDTQKVFKNGKFMFGCTTSYRFIDLLNYSFNIPKHKKNIPDRKYLIDTFIPTLQQCLIDHKYSANSESCKSGICIFVYNNKMYQIQTDFSILSYDRNFNAVGSGGIYALGAMSTIDHNIKPIKLLTRVITEVSKLCTSVSNDIDIIKTKIK